MLREVLDLLPLHATSSLCQLLLGMPVYSVSASTVCHATALLTPCPVVSLSLLQPKPEVGIQFGAGGTSSVRQRLTGC
jgi:hypothetical protein